MRVSRIEPARHAAYRLLALASLLLFALPAAAQVGRPVLLLPPTPAPAAPAPAAPAPNASSQPAGDITAQPLAPVDASWVGQLTAANGGLPRDMWNGSSRSFVAAALPELVPTASPALQHLARGLLLSDAESPPGQDAAGRPTLAALRLDRIYALGLVDESQPLLGALPATAASETFDQTRIELQFAANDVAGACHTVQDRMALYQGNWWDRALIACQALGGDRTKAAFGLSVLAEQKATRDPVFDALVATIDGQPRKIDKLPDPTPLRIALLGAAKLPLPADALAAAGPAALHGYATNQAVPPELRLAAAERALELGAITPEALAQLYAAVPATPAEETAALAAGRPPETPRSRAILFQIARSGAPAETRAAALAALLTDAKKRRAFFATARLVAPLLGEMSVSNTPDGFAGDAARALIAAGHVDSAGPWLAAANAKELLLVAHLAAPDQGAGDSPTLLRDAIAALASRDSAHAQAQAGLLLTLVAAFEPVGTIDWQAVLAPPHAAMVPSPALWVAATDAAHAQRLGDTVLTTLLIAQADGQLSNEPLVLGRAIADLRAAGLESDARAVAVEAALGAGI